MASGPPTTTGLPRERQSSISRSVSACCDNIPPVKTTSAQAKSSSVNDAVLQSTRRTVQLPGNIAATVISPGELRGGELPSIGRFRQSSRRVRNEERIEHQYVARARRVHGYPFKRRSKRRSKCSKARPTCMPAYRDELLLTATSRSKGRSRPLECRNSASGSRKITGSTVREAHIDPNA